MNHLRLGVIGTGSVVREIYQHLYFTSDYSPMLEVTAAADPNQAQLAWFAERARLAREQCFDNYQQMLDEVELDAVHVNTPDHLHEAPVVAALERGLDVLVPKPLAETVGAAHRMIEAAKRGGRLLTVDFHKRSDPRVIDAAARYQNGSYGRFQVAMMTMLDKLLVADPNHEPRFFATADFAENNTPISFLTVHMADTLLGILQQRPVKVQARAWSQKLPALRPIAVQGYDMCDTLVQLEDGGAAHILTGWHLPNTAHAITTGDARLTCTDGQVELPFDRGGNYEITHQGNGQRNPLFLAHDAHGHVSGFGVSHPGQLLRRILEHRRGTLRDEDRTRLLGPFEAGFWTTAILEAAEKSLQQGEQEAAQKGAHGTGTVEGRAIDIDDLIHSQLGEAATPYLEA